MALAVIGQAPHSPEGLAVWSFCHMAHHRDIVRVIFERTGAVLDQYLLDPFDPVDTNAWTYQHQVMHQQMDRVLGIAGYNLSGLDWSNPGGLSGWLAANLNEHYQAAQILEID